MIYFRNLLCDNRKRAFSGRSAHCRPSGRLEGGPENRLRQVHRPHALRGTRSACRRRRPARVLGARVSRGTLVLCRVALFFMLLIVHVSSRFQPPAKALLRSDLQGKAALCGSNGLFLTLLDDESIACKSQTAGSDEFLCVCPFTVEFFRLTNNFLSLKF